MRKPGLLAIVLFCSILAWAGSTFVRPNVKVGLWETTTTHATSGMPPMAIPPGTLDKMPPEQRARIEERMKQSMSGAPKTTTTRYCMTKEKLDKDMAFGEERPECTRTVVSSSATRAEIKVHCQEKEMTSDGTFTFEALTPDSVKGNGRMVLTGHDRTMHMDFDFTSKYLGPACGDVK